MKQILFFHPNSNYFTLHYIPYIQLMVGESSWQHSHTSWLHIFTNAQRRSNVTVQFGPTTPNRMLHVILRGLQNCKHQELQWWERAWWVRTHQHLTQEEREEIVDACVRARRKNMKSVAGAMQRNWKKRGELIKGCVIWPFQSWEPSPLRTRQQTVMQRSINISSGIEKDSNLTKEAGGFVPTM